MVWQSRATRSWQHSEQCNPRCGEEELEKQCLVQLLGPEECWRPRNKVFVRSKGYSRYARAILRPRKRRA